MGGKVLSIQKGSGGKLPIEKEGGGGGGASLPQKMQGRGKKQRILQKRAKEGGHARPLIGKPAPSKRRGEHLSRPKIDTGKSIAARALKLYERPKRGNQHCRKNGALDFIREKRRAGARGGRDEEMY